MQYAVATLECSAHRAHLGAPHATRQRVGSGHLEQALGGTAPPLAKSMDVDYDVYAEGEAELGWLNCTARMSAVEPNGQSFALDDLLLDFVERLREALAAASA